MISRDFLEYIGLWHGDCTESVAARMAVLEEEIAAAEPATLQEARLQKAVALAATGDLQAGALLKVA